MPRSSVLLRISRLIDFLLLLSFVLTVTAWFKKGKLPNPAGISPSLASDPMQKLIREDEFEITWEGQRYSIEPKAEYEISGLVVTHNNPTGLGDIYHDARSVDVRDLCLIWGDNVADDSFHKIEFWSESFSCWYRAPTRELNRSFDKSQLSNNHLVPADTETAEKIRGIHIGDQITLRGMLINYAPADSPGMLRRTSLSRDDTGNGACEVFFVEEVKILSTATPGWYKTYALASLALLILIPLKLFSFGLFAWLEYKLPHYRA